MEVLDLQKKVYIRNGAKYSKFSAFWYLLVQCSVCGQITIYNSQCMANLTLCSDMPPVQYTRHTLITMQWNPSNLVTIMRRGSFIPVKCPS